MGDVQQPETQTIEQDQQTVADTQPTQEGATQSGIGESTDVGSSFESGVTFTPEQKAIIGKMISGRVNEVKKQYEGTEVYKQVVEMMGDIIGTKDVNIINTYLKNLHSQHLAKQMGMTPQGYQVYQQQQQQLQQQVQNTQRALAEREFEKLVNNSKYPDAELYKEEIINLSVNSGLPIQKAYWAVAGEVAAQRMSVAAASDAEHRTLNNISNNRTKQVESGGSGSQESGPKITPEIRAAAEKVGMDPVEYMKYASISTLEQARALKKQP